jgi:hypothetical protein
MQVSQQDCCKPCMLCVNPVIHALCLTVIAQPTNHRNSLLNLPSRHPATTKTVTAAAATTTSTTTMTTTMTATRLRPWQAPGLHASCCQETTAYGDELGYQYVSSPTCLFHGDMQLSPRHNKDGDSDDGGGGDDDDDGGGGDDDDDDGSNMTQTMASCGAPGCQETTAYGNGTRIPAHFFADVSLS